MSEVIQKLCLGLPDAVLSILGQESVHGGFLKLCTKILYVYDATFKDERFVPRLAQWDIFSNSNWNNILYELYLSDRVIYSTLASLFIDSLERPERRFY